MSDRESRKRVMELYDKGESYRRIADVMGWPLRQVKWVVGNSWRAEFKNLEDYERDHSFRGAGKLPIAHRPTGVGCGHVSIDQEIEEGPCFLEPYECEDLLREWGKR